MALRQLLLSREANQLNTEQAALVAAMAEIEARRSTWLERERRAETALSEMTDATTEEERAAFDAESEISNTDTLSNIENEVDDVLDKNDKTNYIGVWETAHYRLTITKGGVGRYEELKENAGHYDLNWEVKDEVLVTQISFFGMEHKAVLELSDDASSLVVLQYGFPAYVESEDTFTKQP